MRIFRMAFVGAFAGALMAGNVATLHAAPLPTNVASMKSMVADNSIQVRWRGGGWGYRGFGGWGYRGGGWGAGALAGALIGGAIASSAYRLLWGPILRRLLPRPVLRRLQPPLHLKTGKPTRLASKPR